MTLHELESSSAVDTFKSTHTHTLICFSATWCGPCKASKPQFEALASSCTKNVKFGIAYEHNLQESLMNYNIRAFPTYVLFVRGREVGRIEGVNFNGMQQMIDTHCQDNAFSGEAYSLRGASGAGAGGGESMMNSENPLSAAEARALRLAKFDKKSNNNNDSTSNNAVEVGVEDTTTTKTKDENENTPMETDNHTNDNENKQSNNNNDNDDVEMKEESSSSTTEMMDPTTNLSKELLDTLTGEMGFTLLRAQKGLLNSNNTVEGAVEWLMNHQDDADIDDPIPLVPSSTDAKAQSYKCNECGKILSNMANLELHANKTGHSDFEESTQAVKPLTEEEKAAKIAEIKALLKAKRTERENAEKVDHVERERQRRSMGQQMSKTREEMEMQARKREAQQRKKEKEAFKKERERIRAELEKDKAERRAHKGKLQSKLGIEGYNPDAIQYDVPTEDGDETDKTPLKKKPKASAAKIDEYISKVSAYRAGGDGGKCLKVLLAYIKNVVENPNEDKFKHINMENKVYKGKVKPFVGAKSLLLAVGFNPNDTGTGLDLDEHADHDVLAATKAKLEMALEAY